MAEGGDSLSSTLAGLRESYYEYNIPKHAEIWEEGGDSCFVTRRPLHCRRLLYKVPWFRPECV